MQTEAGTLPAYLAVLLPVVFVLFWIFVSVLIGMLSGWRTLATEFLEQSEPCGETQTAGPLFYTVYMRFWSHYSGVIRITTAQDALYLSVLAPFRAGHPPLRIPWNEIQVVRVKWRWRPFVLLTLGNEKRIPVRISESMARKLGLLDKLANSVPQGQLRSWSAPGVTAPSVAHPPVPLQ